MSHANSTVYTASAIKEWLVSQIKGTKDLSLLEAFAAVLVPNIAVVNGKFYLWDEVPTDYEEAEYALEEE